MPAIIYALDFDGVLCDSALETGIAGWRAAGELWDDFASPLPPAKTIADFRRVRPILSTGYQAILLQRLLKNGVSTASILAGFDAHSKQILREHNLQISTCQELFGTTRDRWIATDLQGWLAQNPLFRGVAKKLQRLSQQGLWYIVSTKQRRFVQYILAANQVKIADEQIFGLDSGISKPAALKIIAARHNADIYFVEDMLASLLAVQNDQLQAVHLQMATWGYNTKQERATASKHGVSLLDLPNFLSPIFAQ